VAQKNSPRVLLLGKNVTSDIYYTILNGTDLDYIQLSDPAIITLNNNALSSEQTQKNAELRQLVANILASGTASDVRRLSELGIGGIYVPDIGVRGMNKADHDAILTTFDATPELVRLIDGHQQAFWRVSDNLLEKAKWDTSLQNDALASPLRYIEMTILCTILLLFFLLALPFGKRKVIRYES
jgi:hypothetical protein